MPRTHGYIRASTIGQKDSPEQQEEAIRHYQNEKSLPPEILLYPDLAIHRDTPFSERPAGHRMLMNIAKGDEVVITALDRLGSSMFDNISVAGIIMKVGAGLHILNFPFGRVSDDVMGKLFLAFYSVFAEVELNRIRERFKENIEFRKRNNMLVGGRPPYGKKVLKDRGRSYLVDDLEDQAIMAEIWDLHQQGMSTERIYWKFFKEKISPPWGGEYSHDRIKRIIRSEKRRRGAK